MSEFRCDCGPNSGHTHHSQCDANRAATHTMQRRAHQEPLPTIRTEDGAFVRFPEGDEWHLPHMSKITDGVVMRY